MQREESSEEDSSSMSGPLSQITDQEIKRTYRTIKKIRMRKSQLNLLNQRGPLNQLFYLMSKFFFKRKKENKKSQIRREKYKKTREKLISQHSKELPTSKSQLRRYKKDKKLIQLLKKSEQYIPQENQPQIHEQLQPNTNPQNITMRKTTTFPKSGHRCYICKKKHFCCYQSNNAFCFDCGKMNSEKREQTADLSDKIALVTGARIKIGYQIAIRLLLDGATVIASTRFLQDALTRFRQHPSYPSFRHRLFVVQCDFVSAGQVSQLVSYIKTTFPRLDILINNAAQTIARPKQFYASEIAAARKAEGELGYEDILCDALAMRSISTQHTYPSLFMRRSESQDKQIDCTVMDAFGQPLDRRRVNSWVETIENVSLADCLTTQIVNAIVPFHLIGELKGHMGKPAWIINVSAMEGTFYRPYRMNTHPHTNMAKAALNMITRTCSPEFATEQIYMNSVDTGWVSNMYPPHIDKVEEMVPLDCIDGAMRVLDPIYSGVLRNQYPYGLFLKDYKESLF